MKKWWSVLALLVFVSSLIATENGADTFNFQASRDHVLDKRQNYFLTSTDYKITPRVNPITGEYCEEELDLVVAGSQPLSIRRFYNSNAPYDPRYATWRYNPEAFFVANFEWKEQELFAAIGEVDGSVSSFKPSSRVPYAFDFEVPHSLALFGDGKKHPLNTKMTKSTALTEWRGTAPRATSRAKPSKIKPTPFCTLPIINMTPIKTPLKRRSVTVINGTPFTAPFLMMASILNCPNGLWHGLWGRQDG